MNSTAGKDETLHGQCREEITSCLMEQQSLREAHERIARLLESIGDGFVSLDERWRFTYVNAKAEALLSRERGELLGQSLWDAFAGVVGTPFEDYFRRAMQGPVGVFEGFYPPLGIWFEIRAYPCGEGLSIHFQDITGRKRGEKALRESETRFRALVEQAADAFFLHEPCGKIVDVNRQACESLGYSREELLALSVQDVEIQCAASRFPEVWSRMRPGEVVTFEGTHRRKDGSLFPVEIRVVRMETEEGLLLSALARDVTDRKKSEEALRWALTEARQARDKVDVILRSVADGILVAGSHGRIILMNPAAEQMLGISTAEASYRHLSEILPPLPESGDWEWRADGARTIRGRLSSLRGDEGEDAGRIVLLQDITRAREIDRMKNEIISTAAHELRTPLATIMGFSELLLESGAADEEQRREFLSLIHEKSEDLSALIDDLLNLNRIEAGRPICLNRTLFDLGEAVLQHLGQYRRDFPSNHFEAELPQCPLPVLMDRAKIGQVLDNLLSNAVLFSPGGGKTTVEVTADAQGLRLRVRDEGIGMTEEQAGRAFEKFYRVDASNTAVRGLGLGLTVVRAIVEAHGGSVSLESAPGLGTLVTVLFPPDAVGAPHFTAPRERG